MSKNPSFDLSGQWIGTFNYPVNRPSNDFEATLRDHAGSLSGETSEIDDWPGNAAGVVHAIIEGYRRGSVVEFTKIYDSLERAHYSVHYSGSIHEEGNEISGRWAIRNDLSGSFIMVRKGAEEAKVERKERVELPISR